MFCSLRSCSCMAFPGAFNLMCSPTRSLNPINQPTSNATGHGFQHTKHHVNRHMPCGCAGKASAVAAAAPRALDSGPVQLAAADTRALLYKEESAKHLIQVRQSDIDMPVSQRPAMHTAPLHTYHSHPQHDGTWSMVHFGLEDCIVATIPTAPSHVS